MAKQQRAKDGEVLVCRNAKALKSFDVEERYEAGLVLVGSEVKALRAKRADLDGAYASIDRGEAFLHKMHVGAYEHAGAFGHEPKRSRKLLLSAVEISRIQGRLTTRGYTLVPIRVYFKGGWAKVELGLGRARRVGDRREALRRDADLREVRDALEKGR